LIEPVKVRLTSGDVDVRFRESPESETLSLVQAKTNASSGVAAYVYVSVCLDEEKKLQGKYSSKAARRQKDEAAATSADYTSGMALLRFTL
jgi:hypothetical protein